MLELATPIPPAARTAACDVISQIKIAFATPLPLIIGALLGALVPLATYTVGHTELAAAGWASVPGTIVIGGCLFSAITVYKWGRRAFDCAFKALGFVVLSEGVMTFSQTPWLSIVVLGFLVAINAVANGANLAVAHLEASRTREEQGHARHVADIVTPSTPTLTTTPQALATTPVSTASTVLAPSMEAASAPAAPTRKRVRSSKSKLKSLTPRRPDAELN